MPQRDGGVKGWIVAGRIEHERLPPPPNDALAQMTLERTALCLVTRPAQLALGGSPDFLERSQGPFMKR